MYENCFPPIRGSCTESERYSIITPFKWSAEKITVEFDLIRQNGNITTLRAVIPANKYEQFQSMQGAVRCIGKISGDEYILKFQPDDVIRIISDDYSQVESAFHNKCERYLIAQDAKWLQMEQDRCNKRKAEEAERMKHFWYRLFHRRKTNG